MTTATETMYPQYEIRVKWEQDGEDGERIPNSVNLHRMYREEREPDDLERETREEWWPEYVSNKLADKNPSAPEIEVTDKGRESWVLTWFEHWTFDVGQTDAEALESFERYVRRYEHMQDSWRADEGPPEGYRCLMGAEDRWRWKAGEGYTAYGRELPPPCRCEHCREQGVLRIGH